MVRGARKLDTGAVTDETHGNLIETNETAPSLTMKEGGKTERADDDLGYTNLHAWSGTKLGKNLGEAKQRQLARKKVQQISTPPTCTSTTEISDDGSTGLRLLTSGRGLEPP